MIAMLIQDLLEEAGATSFAFAATEQDAVMLALQQRPAVITSDVRLLEGTGPVAVERIIRGIGETSVVFITANPDACERGGVPRDVLTKPFSCHDAAVVFQKVIPH